MSIPPLPLRDLFEGALALAPDERAAYLQLRCADPQQRLAVDRMLAADRSEDERLLDQPFDDLLGRVGEPEIEAPMPPPGTRIGSFTLLDKLGEGGSSVVFRAEREHSGAHQQVALKLLRRGLYAEHERRHFRDERRALAQLRHPGIAHLIEGGVTDAGVPYIALELIDGLPITDHVREHALDLRGRLLLFTAVCYAVDAAHRALIVHRDLKPSNVLVTRDGAVKLLDFGIAKLLDTDGDDATHTHSRAMTPAYAAPEQFNGGPITTATDVYALGILLGELMTGHRRSHGDTRTPSSQISLDTGPGVLPSPPEKTRRQLRGDLDNIVLTATCEEPVRRYASAAMLAADLERHLANQPVVAHPPSVGYRTRKFVARHRGGVAITVAFLLAILAALAIALWQASVARAEAQRSASVRDFLLRVFSAAEPAGPRLAPPSVTDVVRAAIVDANRSTSLDSAVRIELLSTLGRVLGAQGDMDGGVALLDANWKAALKALGPSHPTTSMAALELAQAQTAAGQHGPARILIDALLAQTDRSRDADFGARVLSASARLGVERFEQARALDESQRAMELCEHACTPQTRVVVQLTRGNALAAFQHDEAAIPVIERALALQRTLFDGPHVDIADTLQSLSRAHRRLGHLDAAEGYARESLAIVEASVPDPHVRRTDALDTLRQVLIDSRSLDEAIALGRRIVAMDRATLGPDHPGVATSENTLGYTYAMANQTAPAIEHFNSAIAISERIPDNVRKIAIYRANLGNVVGRSGDSVTGARLVQSAIDALRGLPEPDYGQICSALEKLGSLQRNGGKLDAALATFTESDRLYREKLPDAPKQWRAVTLVALGRTHIDRHEDSDAERRLHEALASVTTPAGILSPERVEARAALADIAHRRGDDATARDLLSQVDRETGGKRPALGTQLQTYIDSLSAAVMPP
ncbi:MAG: tetratricopeptide repeat protein [Dokdonella sp.]|uniref:protein kinase domain-containing protein n=1 Tax=Dokdonella sp. TaxID=2291710 RepID=UPI003264F1F0